MAAGSRAVRVILESTRALSMQKIQTLLLLRRRDQRCNSPVIRVEVFRGDPLKVLFGDLAEIVGGGKHLPVVAKEQLVAAERIGLAADGLHAPVEVGEQDI